MNFVLDNLVAMLWLLPQSNPSGLDYAEAALEALKTSQALTPSLWPLEVANVIAKTEKKGVVTEAETQTFLSLLRQLNIVIDPATADQALSETLNLARRYRLSAYDAAYLELALRRNLPIATLDTDLARAASLAGVAPFARH